MPKWLKSLKRASLGVMIMNEQKTSNSRGCLTIMIVVLGLTIALWIFSGWYHKHTLCRPDPISQTGMYCRTGLDALDFITPVIGGIIIVVIVPVTLITAKITK